MKIALISDIHGNLPALEAVMNDIATRKVDKIICLGDMIGKGPSSKEVIDICKNKCDIVIRGNWDKGLFDSYNELKCDIGAPINDRERWYIHDAGSLRMEYLGTLPHLAEIYLSGKLIRLFHAHPLNFNRYYSDSPIEQRLELFEYNQDANIKRQSDVAVYADIHGAYMQMIEGKMLINIGSVGNPLDITQASYVVLEGDEHGDVLGLNVQFMRVPYDIERAVVMARESNIPDLEGYVAELTTAQYFRRT